MSIFRCGASERIFFMSWMSESIKRNGSPPLIVTSEINCARPISVSVIASTFGVFVETPLLVLSIQNGHLLSHTFVKCMIASLAAWSHTLQLYLTLPKNGIINHLYQYTRVLALFIR